MWLSFIHHDSAESLRESISLNCSICCTLGNALGIDVLDQIRQETVALRSTAQLSVVSASETENDLYRLDISMEWSGENVDRTFVLKQIGMLCENHLYYVFTLTNFTWPPR